jgi:ATPases involved in chromosome partitioning
MMNRVNPDEADDVGGDAAQTDVHHLFDELGLAAGRYRAFGNRLSPNAAPAAANRVRSEHPEPGRSSHSTVEQASASSAPAPARVEPSPARVPELRGLTSNVPPQEVSTTSRLALLRHSAVLSPRPESGGSAVIGLASCSGGAGATTLAVSLATALSAARRHGLLLAGDCTSPLACHLGLATFDGAGPEPGALRYVPIEGEAMMPIGLLCGAGGPATSIEIARRLVPDAAALVMDVDSDADFVEAIAVLDLLIVPLRPDINALTTSRRVDHELARAARRPPQGVWFLLNQFDERNEVHRAVHRALQQRLGERLLPVVLPWDALVPEALASGRPPQVYAPEAPFSGRVGAWAAWVTSRLPTLQASRI